MFSVTYKGFRPTGSVTLIPENSGEKNASDTLLGGFRDDYLEHFKISDVEPYELTMDDLGASVALVDFLNLSLATDQTERISEFISLYGFPVRAYDGESFEEPNLEANIKDILAAIKNFRAFYNWMTRIDTNDVNVELITKTINNHLSHPAATRVEMSIDENGNMVPRIISRNIFLFCVFSALSAWKENRPVVTCQNCGSFYQKGRTARKDAVYCGSGCRMAAHRRKKAATVTTV